MEKLARELRRRLDLEHMSLRDAGQAMEISHSTVARAMQGYAVDIATMVKMCEFLNVPVESVLELRDEPENSLKNLNFVLSTEPELSQAFYEVAVGIVHGEIDKKILAEIAAFVRYRLEQHKNR